MAVGLQLLKWLLLLVFAASANALYRPTVALIDRRQMDLHEGAAQLPNNFSVNINEAQPEHSKRQEPKTTTTRASFPQFYNPEGLPRGPQRLCTPPVQPQVRNPPFANSWKVEKRQKPKTTTTTTTTTTTSRDDDWADPRWWHPRYKVLETLPEQPQRTNHPSHHSQKLEKLQDSA
ncbi:hypothetical protein QBC37DRAFT_404396 [Rhypophila decipiens]|uniref:Uncharacterized protein n=1 Tax=Rhypophila decipiens TaxID=261697 RepID=A0AAN7B3X6_9PEZI|nr:hypothetical protein QBC37DRAFT_404396 [Rhypophila decipiens]